MSNKYNLKKVPVYGGFTIIYHRKEQKWELVDAPYGHMSRRELTNVMCRMINIPQHELALAYTEFQLRPETVRAEFGQNGHFLFVD